MLARSLQAEFDHRQQRLGDVMTHLGYGYGGPAGVAHAAEIAPEQREEFAEYWTAGVFSLPPRPNRPSRPQPSPPPRRTWRRQAHPYYTELDERNDPDSGPESAVGAPDHGTSQHRDNGDGSDGSDNSDNSDEEDDRMPPSPPSPYSKRH
jgi:hypothetical protein